MGAKTLIAWSSGKDSAWVLHALRQRADVDVVGLFCTVDEQSDRVAMHGVRADLLRLQAQRVGLPIHLIAIPDPCDGVQYEARMSAFVADARAHGIERFAFGDLFLDGVRRYRETNLRGTGVAPVFPLWGMPTHELARAMQAAGLRARITCVDPRWLSREFVGREFDAAFLDALPAGVDPCGEHGEFHTFVFDGPPFDAPIPLHLGEVVERDGLVFADLRRPPGETR